MSLLAFLVIFFMTSIFLTYIGRRLLKSNSSQTAKFLRNQRKTLEKSGASLFSIALISSVLGERDIIDQTIWEMIYIPVVLAIIVGGSMFWISIALRE